MKPYQSTKILFFVMCLLSLTTFSFAYSEPQKETWLNLRGQQVSVFSTSVEPLLVRGYFEQKFVNDITYSGNLDIQNTIYDENSFSLILNISESNKGSLLLLTIPRDVLDATHGYDKEKQDFEIAEFLVVVNDSEVSYEDISYSKANRTIFLKLEPHSSVVEIIGTCIPEACHQHLK